MPYTEKLLLALRPSEHTLEPEIRARVVMLLGEFGDAGDPRVAQALLQALEVDPRDGSIDNISVQEVACLALGHLGVCEASPALARLAQEDASALIVSLSAVEGLRQLAHAGCAQAIQQIEHIARTAQRDAIRVEASLALARLNEPE